MKRIFVPVLTIILAAVSVTATATIVPNRGIAGVTLDMRPAQVKAVLGKPLRIERGSADFGPFVNYLYRGLRVNFLGGQAVNISTTRTSERTRGGVGVGTTEVALVARIPSLRCESFGSTRICTLGQQNAGQRVTDFFIAKGKVSRVVVGLVID